MYKSPGTVFNYAFFFAFNLIIHIQVKDMRKNATFQQPTELNGMWNYVAFTQYTNN